MAAWVLLGKDSVSIVLRDSGLLCGLPLHLPLGVVQVDKVLVVIFVSGVACKLTLEMVKVFGRRSLVLFILFRSMLHESDNVEEAESRLDVKEEGVIGPCYCSCENE